MKTYFVEHCRGMAGHENVLDTDTVEATCAAEAIRQCTVEHDWPIDTHDEDFASQNNPEASERYFDGWIAELAYDPN